MKKEKNASEMLVEIKKMNFVIKNIHHYKSYTVLAILNKKNLDK